MTKKWFQDLVKKWQMRLNTWLISPTPHQVSDLLYLLTPGFGICHSITPFSFFQQRSKTSLRGDNCSIVCPCILILLLLPFIRKWISTHVYIICSFTYSCLCLCVEIINKNFLLFFSEKKCFMFCVFQSNLSRFM